MKDCNVYKVTDCQHQATCQISAQTDYLVHSAGCGVLHYASSGSNQIHAPLISHFNYKPVQNFNIMLECFHERSASSLCSFILAGTLDL